jgi:myo-inositol-1(or 4)-monophosphatase
MNPDKMFEGVPTMTLEDMLILIVKDAGDLLRENAFKLHDLEWKKKDDPVTELDRMAEERIVIDIAGHMPANFLGEEYGLDDRGAKHTFIIDPIDGTKAYLRQDFLCAMSVGVEEEGELIGGVVYDFMRDIMYVGFKGDLYRISHREKLPFSTGFEGTSKTRLVMEKDHIAGNPFQYHKGISVSTRLGSIALCMAQAAAGAFDGLIIPAKTNSNVWDIAAGYYMLKESGLDITDMDGKPFDYRQPTNGIIALKNRVSQDIRSILENS